MSAEELTDCPLPIPAGFRFVAFREAAEGEWAVGREGNAIHLIGSQWHYDSGKVLVIRPVNPVGVDDYLAQWPLYMARRCYIAMDDGRKREWIMYSDARLPVFDPVSRQWSGDVLCNLSQIRRAIPGLPLPDDMEASESLRWVG